MISSITQTVAPTQLPVDLELVKTRLKITHVEEDTLLDGYIRAATKYAEEYQWAQYITATFVERWDCFQDVIRPLRSPLLTVTSLAYVDTSGNTQTLTANTDYTVDVYSKPGRIVPAYSKWWPATRGHVNDVTLTYTAGYGNPSDVPEEVKIAIILKVDQQRSSCEKPETLDRPINMLLDLRSFRTFY